MSRHIVGKLFRLVLAVGLVENGVSPVLRIGVDGHCNPGLPGLHGQVSHLGHQLLGDRNMEYKFHDRLLASDINKGISRSL